MFDAGPMTPERWILLRGRVLTKLALLQERPAKYRSSRGTTRIDEVVLHDTGSIAPFDRALAYAAAADDRKVSVHYYVGRETGQLFRMVPERYAAHHADDPRENIGGHNARSVGIEMYKLEKDKGDFTDWQYEAVSQLVYGICWRNQIPLAAVVAHAAINPKHRADPRNFDWDRFEMLIKGLSRTAFLLDENLLLPLPKVSMRLPR